MTTLELEKPVEQTEPCQAQDVQEIDKKALCYKLCASILESLLEGYNELKDKNPEKEDEYLRKIEELKHQLVLN